MMASRVVHRSWDTGVGPDEVYPKNASSSGRILLVCSAVADGITCPGFGRSFGKSRRASFGKDRRS